MDSPPWLMIVKCLAVSRLSRASLEDDPPWNGITVFLGFHVLIGLLALPALGVCFQHLLCLN